MDALDQALITLISLGEDVEDKLADGKITLVEGISLLPKAFGVVNIVKNFGEIRTIIANLTDEEKQAKIALVQNELDLDNDKLESIIELAFTAIISMLDLFELFKQPSE